MTSDSKMETPRSPSVLEVAREAGVSQSTVCRVINGRASVSKSANARVLDACARLGFKKNAAASALRLRSSGEIACLMPDNSNEMFIDKVFHLKQAALKLGKTWRLHSFRDPGEAFSLLEEIVGSRPAGAIIGFPPDERARSILASNEIPVVCYDSDDPVFDSVSLDRAAGMAEAARLLVSLGRRGPLLLGFPESGERTDACLRAFSKAGLDIPSELIWSRPFGRDLFIYGYEEAAEALSKVAFDSVFAINDASAIGCMRRLHERGIRTPEDIPVVGFDDIMAASYTTPSLSTIAQPKERMAQKAVSFLARRMANPSLPRQSARLSTKFVRRESA